ncbi:CAP domain-containing protein [Sporosarcina highlanderae]|uniref:CAP domain-containing protein n=1 Tax=Sporosarcina highlanderae TaxID=3035916 RepID=A0ABT8JRE1_9BACL|nr:CAP domain-containing protein [Sporosarcina highlanderae]MDN4607639.1 CAP domain-containing protein [Sporosarcina highlanderae]
MKKSVAVILLGSALLLPNNNSVEASYHNNDNVVKYAKTKIECYSVQGQVTSIYNQEGNRGELLNKYLDAFNKQFGYQFTWQQPSTVTKNGGQSKPVEQAKPVEEAKPVEKPAEQANPVEQARPTETQQQQPSNTVSETSNSTQNTSVSAIEKAVLDLTNVERQKAGLKPLQIDEKLMASARQKSADMSKNNYFDHNSPTYGSPFDQMKANGVSYRSAAENIAMGQRSAEEVVKAWMESPGHRQNILTPEFTHIGIGFVQNGNYWTQQFIQK